MRATTSDLRDDAARARRFPWTIEAPPAGGSLNRLYEQHSREFGLSAYARWRTRTRRWTSHRGRSCGFGAVGGRRRTFRTRELVAPGGCGIWPKITAKSASAQRDATPELLTVSDRDKRIPDDEMERKEQFAQLRNGVDELSPADREILPLRTLR